MTSHAAMLGRTLLYTAVTRARQLVVIVGQQRALAMAVKDWRRVERHTAFAGLLDGSLRYGWTRGVMARDDDHRAVDLEAWDGVLEAGPNG